MEQPGEVPEPEEPVAQPTSPLPPPAAARPSAGRSGASSDDEGGGDDRPEARWFVVVGVLALVVVVGLVAWMARGDDALDAVERQDERFPPPTTVAPPTTTAAPTTVAAPAPPPPTTAAPVPPTTVAPTTVAPTVAPTDPPTIAPTVPPTALPASAGPGTTVAVGTPGGSTVPPPPDDPDYIAALVPNVAGFTESLSTPELAQVQIDQMLASGRHDVAVAGPVATICAAVPMDRPLAVRGRWERDGRRVASTDLERRDAPGFGECLTNGGNPLDDGSYQYIAADSESHESAAGGIVVGADRIDQRFRNDEDTAICTVRIAPHSSRYFEVYVFTAQPIAPLAAVTIPVAAVEQDVEAIGCDDTVVASFSFTPSTTAVQPIAP